jgi:hypothetical protein
VKGYLATGGQLHCETYDEPAVGPAVGTTRPCRPHVAPPPAPESARRLGCRAALLGAALLGAEALAEPVGVPPPPPPPPLRIASMAPCRRRSSDSEYWAETGLSGRATTGRFTASSAWVH